MAPCELNALKAPTDSFAGTYYLGSGQITARLTGHYVQDPAECDYELDESYITDYPGELPDGIQLLNEESKVIIDVADESLEGQ